MRYKEIIDEDFTNYKEPAMFICAISCEGKCYTETNSSPFICQNIAWKGKLIKEASNDEIIRRFKSNPITTAIVFGGLEPLEQFSELIQFISSFRYHHCYNDTIVIYTGFCEDEIEYELNILRTFPNIVVKFGRYVPFLQGRYDEVLGAHLASENQYAKKIS